MQLIGSWVYDLDYFELRSKSHYITHYILLTIVVCEISALTHKSRYNPVECRIFVAVAVFSSAECSEVFRSFWHNVCSQLKYYSSYKRKIIV